MEMTTFLPSEALKPYVRYFYTLQGCINSVDEARPFRIIADGCPGIMFQNSDKGLLTRDGETLAPAFLFGQATQHADLYLSGRFDTIGVCLNPSALYSIFGLDAQVLTDSCVELDQLAERLGNITTTAQKIDLIGNYLIERLTARTHTEERSIQYAMDKIIHSGGSIPIQHLQKELYLSERTFERKFKQHVGLTPKLFSRICSFQSSLRQLNLRQFDKFADIAYQNNYADQSHLIRAFREFAGVSPNQYFKHATDVCENLTMLGGPSN